MKHAPRGYLVAEAVTAAALVAILLGLCLKMSSVTALARRAIERRAVAQQEAANLIEHVASMTSDELTPERLADLSLSSDVKEILPDGAATFSVEPTTSGPPGKQVRVEINWTAPSGEREAPLRLNYWAFSPSPAGAQTP